MEQNAEKGRHKVEVMFRHPITKKNITTSSSHDKRLDSLNAAVIAANQSLIGAATHGKNINVKVTDTKTGNDIDLKLLWE